MQPHVLTEYEKDHIGERQALPEQYLGLSDQEMDTAHRCCPGRARPDAWSSSVIITSATK